MLLLQACVEAGTRKVTAPVKLTGCTKLRLLGPGLVRSYFGDKTCKKRQGLPFPKLGVGVDL